MANKGSLGTTLRAVFQRVAFSNIFYKNWIENNEKLFLVQSKYNNLIETRKGTPHWEGVYVHLEKYLINKTIFEETYHNQKHSFAKAVWLTDCMFKDGGFKYPICTHYNPREDAIEIHPGSSRMVIYDLFNPNSDLNFFYFSTYGKEYNFMTSKREILEDELKQMELDGYDVVISADHGAFIPHVTFDGGQTTPAGKVWHQKCREVISTRKIYLNKDIKELNLFKKVDKKEDADLVIEIKDELIMIDIIRLTYLSFLNYKYEDTKISVIPKSPSPSKL